MFPNLTDTEPPAFTVHNEQGKGGVVLLCDHASNYVPSQLQNLGLDPELLTTHIAWDIGALWVARFLSERLDAPLVFSNYSRLVIDCNRCPEREDLVPASSADIPIPGNTQLSPLELASRRTRLFDPYHNAIDTLLQTRAEPTTLLLSIHSFTPTLHLQDRPWPIGVCYQNNSAMAKCWRVALQEQLSDSVGDNEPYAVELGIDYTLPMHGDKHNIPAIMLEIRQDEIATEVAANSWGETIATAWGHHHEKRKLGPSHLSPKK